MSGCSEEDVRNVGSRVGNMSGRYIDVGGMHS
jgi:hypothetical protein